MPPIPQPEKRFTAELQDREVSEEALDDSSDDRTFDTLNERPAEPKVLESDSLSSIPMPDQPAVTETVYDIPLVEDVEIIETAVPGGDVLIEEELVLPADAVKIIGDLEQFEPLLEDELKVKILGSEEFSSGDRKNVNVLVFRGTDERAVAGAGIMVKVLGSDFRPQIFHAVADSNGVAAVSITIPDFRSGRAAVLVRAMIGNEEAEIRRVIKLTDV